MVFGTCTTLILSAAISLTLSALYAVSSPPIVISLSTSNRRREVTVFSRCLSSFVGFALEIPMYDPPRK